MVGAPDDERGQIVKAFVVLRPAARPTPALVEELQDFVKREIAPYKYPRAIEFVASPAAHRDRQAAALPAARGDEPRPGAISSRGLAAAQRLRPRRPGRGTPAVSPDRWAGTRTGEFASDDLAAQVRKALENVVAVLRAAGAEPRHIARLTWYVTDKAEYLAARREIGAAYRECIGTTTRR